MNNGQQMDMFKSLVFSLASNAMQHLGKTVNVLQGKVSQNLPAAQVMIDMLDMFETKTRGNLTEDELKLLTSVLADLKMNYFECMKEKEAKPADAPKDPSSSEQVSDAPPTA